MINSMRDAGLDPGTLNLLPDSKLHRYDVAGDKPLSKNGWYVLFDDGDIQAGRFGSWKTGDNIAWCSKSKNKFTPEEKKAYAAKMEAARREKEKEQQLIYEKCRIESAEKWAKAESAPENHPYLSLKQVPSYGLRASGEALMVPVCEKKGVLAGIQYIFPDGSKKFKTGTAKKGAYHTIGKPVDNTVIICEGYATGASIHMATGHLVMVAFDAGNLKTVAEKVRSKSQSWNIIIAADDDQWWKETQPDGTVIYHEVPCTLNGKLHENAGLVKATEAARAVNGILRKPRFTDLESKPTDFNDLHRMAGLAAVKVCIFPPPVEEYNPNYDIEAEINFDPYDEDKTRHEFHGAPFKLLGYNRGEYYYMPNGTKQIKVLRAPEHTKSHLMELAKLQWWEGSTFANKSGFNVDAAANAMIQTSQGVGVYDAGKIRGRGAWFDDGRSVIHVGNELIINGNVTPIEKINSEYVYERSIKIGLSIGTETLSNKQAFRLEELCNSLSWQRKELSGKLLAGWCALSAICGALSWRPHIHLTGGAGCGKSWIIDNIVRPIAGPIALVVQGATSEAGIRQSLGADARPVIFDEAEGEDHRAHQRMQSILELARQASSETGGSIFKGTTNGRAMSFRIRSMFCFASIGISQTQQADQSRISILTLKAKNDGGKYFSEVVVPLWKEVVTESFCSSLRARLVKMIPVIVDNAAILSTEVGLVMENKRAGDQLGTLLAGDWALRSTGLINRDDAKKYVSSIDWSEHKISPEQSDEQRCLATMLEALVRMPSGDNISIADLIREVSNGLMIDDNSPAHIGLKNHGFRVLHNGNGIPFGGFAIANQHAELKKIMEKTPWPANWGQILSRLPGVLSSEKVIRFSGTPTKAKIFPITYVEGE